MKEITLRLSDNEYSDYVRKGQSMYGKGVRRKIFDEGGILDVYYTK